MKVPDTQENMMKCICMKCPSYNMCMKEKVEGLYCSKGKSACGFKEIGCTCAHCPLWPEYKLKILYHCVTGAE